MAENNIQVFENSEFGSVRTVERNGEPWFCGKDVATALGYVDVKSALADHIDAEDRQILQRRQIATLEDVPNRGMTFINESGLYSLVLSSKLPSAKKFKRWVFDELIPKIKSQQKPHEIVSNNGIQTFKNAEFGQIRMLEENGEILFCALDVASALGYSNARDAVATHCDDVVKRDATDSTGACARDVLYPGKRLLQAGAQL